MHSLHLVPLRDEVWREWSTLRALSSGSDDGGIAASERHGLAVRKCSTGHLAIIHQRLEREGVSCIIVVNRGSATVLWLGRVLLYNSRGSAIVLRLALSKGPSLEEDRVYLHVTPVVSYCAHLLPHLLHRWLGASADTRALRTALWLLRVHDGSVHV